MFGDWTKSFINTHVIANSPFESDEIFRIIDQPRQMFLPTPDMVALIGFFIAVFNPFVNF